MVPAPSAPLRLALGIVLISISGNLGASLVPLAVGELIEPVARGGAGLSLQFAGGLQTAELVAIAAGSALSPAVGGRQRALKALAVAFFLTLGCIAVRGPALLPLRVLEGFAVGAALGAAMARVDDCSDPERVYTWGTAANALAASLSLMLGGRVATSFGLSGIFILIAVSFLPGLLGAILLGEPPAPSANTWQTRSRLSASARLITAGLFLLNLAFSAVFSILEPIAVRVQLDKAELGMALGSGPLLGLATVLGIGYFVPRSWYVPLALVLLAVTGLFLCQLFTPTGAGVLAFGILVVSATYYAAIPPLMALGTSAGPAERAAPAMSAAIVLGAALGPGLGGLLEEQGLLAGAIGPISGSMLICAALGTRSFPFQHRRAS